MTGSLLWWQVMALSNSLSNVKAWTQTVDHCVLYTLSEIQTLTANYDNYKSESLEKFSLKTQFAIT